MAADERNDIVQAQHDLASIPEIPEEELDLARAVRVPIAEISALGVAFASLPQSLRAVSGGSATAMSGTGLCRLVDAGGNPLPVEALQRFKDGTGYLGSTYANGTFSQARILPVGDATVSQSVEMADPYDPTMLFLAVALMQVNQKLDAISDMQEKMFAYAKERDRAEPVAGFKILDDIKQNYRFNGGNDQWLSTRHALVVGAWKDAEAAIELSRKRRFCSGCVHISSWSPHPLTEKLRSSSRKLTRFSWMMPERFCSRRSQVSRNLG